MSAERIKELLDEIQAAADVLHTDDHDAAERPTAHYSTSNIVEELMGIFMGDYWPDERSHLGERVIRLRDALAGLAELRDKGGHDADQLHVWIIGLLDKLRMDVVLIERQRAAAPQTNMGDPV